jgi:hypothetical protein
MNAKTLEFCQKEIADLLSISIICKSKSPWSCAAFYVIKNTELERGTPRLGTPWGSIHFLINPTSLF